MNNKVRYKYLWSTRNPLAYEDIGYNVKDKKNYAHRNQKKTVVAILITK